MLKLFKKKEKPVEPEMKDFSYTILMRDGTTFKCMGRADTKNRLALVLSDKMEDFKNFFYTLEDGGKVLLWSDEILFVKID